MAELPFDDPRVALNRIYTKRGDTGETGLAGGQRVSKDSPRREAYGTVDERNAVGGRAYTSAEQNIGQDLRVGLLLAILRRVQHELFNLGSMLATLPEDLHPKQARITSIEIGQLEKEIDAMNEDLLPLRSFVLPGGTRMNAELHLARTVCRRAERLVVALAKVEEVQPEAIQYLNRLSDAMFVWSRWINFVLRAPEVVWQPNQAASARKITSLEE